MRSLRYVAILATCAAIGCGLSAVGQRTVPDEAGIGSVDGGGADGGGDGGDGASSDVTLLDGAIPEAGSDGQGPCGSTQMLCKGACCSGICAANACKQPSFWVSADVGVSTVAGQLTWRDRSGHGNDVKQPGSSGGPGMIGNAINGRPALSFNGQRLEGTNAAAFRPGTGDLSWFHVTRNHGAAGPVYKHQVFGTLLSADPFSGITAGYGMSDHPYGMFRQLVDNQVEAPNGSLEEWVIIDARRSSGNVELHRDGALVQSNLSLDNVNGGPIVVGSQNVGGTEYLDGDIAEIILFATSLTAAEQTGIAQYLSARYAIPLL